jgi:hypothetical protein
MWVLVTFLINYLKNSMNGNNSLHFVKVTLTKSQMYIEQHFAQIYIRFV